MDIEIDFGGGSLNGITQFAGNPTAGFQEQDGYMAGTLQSFSVDRTGTIIGSFSNGNSLVIGQIALASFNNPEGLVRGGDNLYTLSDGTERILESIGEPINLYFYFSDRATENIPSLRSYATRVREMLEEFAKVTRSVLIATLLGATVLFILALGGLSHQETARRGNL